MEEFTVTGGEHVINSHEQKSFLIFDAMWGAGSCLNVAYGGPAVIVSG